MKVQDVKQECLATVGLSIEFSNKEIVSIDKVLSKVDTAIENAVAQQIKNGQKLDPNKDNIPVSIDLKEAKRIQWLLYQMTIKTSSQIFAEADREYQAEVNSINNTITVK